ESDEARPYDPQVRVTAEGRAEVRLVASPHAALEGRTPGERLGAALSPLDRVLIGGERRAQAGLESYVCGRADAPLRDRAERPPRCGERQQREQCEIRRELELETADVGDLQGHPPPCRYCAPREVSANEGESMRPAWGRAAMGALLLAGTASALAVPVLLQKSATQPLAQLPVPPATRPHTIVHLPPPASAAAPIAQSPVTVSPAPVVAQLVAAPSPTVTSS